MKGHMTEGITLRNREVQNYLSASGTKKFKKLFSETILFLKHRFFVMRSNVQVVYADVKMMLKLTAASKVFGVLSKVA
ncbi:hypothetical protein T02_11912 [Trichinella nativa]|uniref:Uncharacterized protein n=1 Tax=Trichinella nativa TaxID=6335 RepID=A0A0V1L998_9BILA|nr:hypothetical protein T02_11912 [Trichinella nativa]